LLINTVKAPSVMNMIPTGMLEAEKSFRRLKTPKQLPVSESSPELRVLE
jgi:hypothetical protein